jgi:hypothetical protein
VAASSGCQAVPNADGTANGCEREDRDGTVASAGWTGDGGVWLYYQGWYYVMAPSYGYASADPSGLYPTTATIGKPTWDALTSNVLVNQILLDSNNRMIDTVLSPTCIEVVGNVCYY